MELYRWTAFLFLVTLFAAACQNQLEVLPTEAPPTEATTTEIPPMQTPPAVVPTEIPTETTTPTEQAIVEVIAGFCDQIDPTLIDLNSQGLFDGWQADCVPAGAYEEDGPVIGGLPEHLQITFDGLNSSSREPGDAVLYVIPTEAYRVLWDETGNPFVGEQLDALRGWVDRRPNAVRTQDMPVLPVEEAGAFNDLAVQGEYLDFGAWDGIRFVGRFGQGPTPVTNEGLRYIFQGFAGEDDEYFIAYFSPVTTPQLPPTIEEISGEDFAAFESDPSGSINLSAVELNELTEADWRPPLNVLDELVGSLQYGGQETGEEAPEIEPQPVAGRPSSYAIVSGASGVNVRTGPSTAFPSLGVAPFGTQLVLIGRSLDGQWWVTPIQGAPNDRGWVSAGFVDAFNTAALPVMSAPQPPPTPTATPPPIPTPAAPSSNFWVDRATINQGECTTLRWSVENIQAVWVYPVGENFERYPATGDGSRQVCPSQTTTYEIRVQLRDGSVTAQQVTIAVNPGNSLADSNWVLASFGGGQPMVPGAPPTVSFGAGNYVSGFGGCNTFWGNYSVFGGNGLAMSVGPRSLVACDEEITDQEARFLDALQGTGSFESNGNQLIMRDTGGVETLRFIRQ